MTKLSVCKRSFTNIIAMLLFSACLIFLSSGTGMAIIAEGDFEGISNDTTFRANGPGQDWYESRADDPSLLLHDTTNIGGHTSQAKLITSTALGEAYLSQDFSSPVTGISDIEWDIYIEEILDIDGSPDRAGFMLIGDDSDSTTTGPNSDDDERFVCMAFLKDGGGSTGTMDLVAQDNNAAWATITEDLNLNAWHKIKVRCYFEDDEYNIYVDDIFALAVPARDFNLSSLEHISFAQLSDGAGTFYIDDVSQTDFYTLNSEIVGEGTVDITPEGETHDYEATMTLYDTSAGTAVTLTATPETGWEFTEWSGAGLSGNDLEATLVMDSDKNVTATFLETFDLTVTPVGNGTVTLYPADGPYVDGTEIELTPVADPGWEFTEWSEDLSGSDDPATIIMDDDKDVTATFLETFDLTVTSVGNGTVTLDPADGPYVDGTEVQLTPTADPGWEFTGWEGDLSGNDNPATITMDSDKNVTATFALMTYDLNVTITGDGTVTLDPPTGPYEHGTTVTLTAAPEVGRHFTEWSGDITGTILEETLLMDGEKNVTANFEINTYTVTFIEGNNGSIDGDRSQTITHGGSCTEVEANADNGYNFLSWTGDYIGNANPLILANVTSNMTITGNFDKDIFSVVFTTSDGGSITGEAYQEIPFEENCAEVTATPETGYHFVGWTGDYEGTDNPLTITNMTTNLNIIANFEINIYTITFSTNENGGLSDNRNQSVPHGSSNTPVTAYPAEGYQFLNWTGVPAEDESDDPLIIENVTSDMTIIANFVLAFDGNNDDIPDALQNHIENLTAENEEIVTVEFADSSTILACETVDDPSPDDRPTQYDFEYGLIRFVIDDVETGGATTVTIYLPDGASPVTYFKYGPTIRTPEPHWYEFMYDGTTGAEIDGNEIILHFVDGERGDDDLAENGKIIDDGGPGFSDIPVTPDADGSGDSQGASGGCFIGEASFGSFF